MRKFIEDHSISAVSKRAKIEWPGISPRQRAAKARHVKKKIRAASQREAIINETVKETQHLTDRAAQEAVNAKLTAAGLLEIKSKSTVQRRRSKLAIK
jgi:hypothetical protein